VLYAVYRLVRFLVRLDDALPTLLDIADEFKTNGGGSLRDAVDRLELGQRALLMDRGYATLEDLLNATGTHHESPDARAVRHDEIVRRHRPFRTGEGFGGR